MPSDASKYCARCKKRRDCASPCYPVEQLLKSVTKPLVELRISAVDLIDTNPSDVFEPPESWVRKSTKRKIFDLYFIDHLTQTHVAGLVGCNQQYVSVVTTQILELIDKL